MKLYLMRHGQYVAEDIHSRGFLSEKGEAEIRGLAQYLHHAAINVSHTFHSGKPRAQQTAELMMAGIASDHPPEVRNGLNPMDDPHAFAEEISDWDQDILIVGHLPFMSRLISKLVVGKETRDIVLFYPGSIVCLEKIENERWVILWMLNPAIVLGEGVR